MSYTIIDHESTIKLPIHIHKQMKAKQTIKTVERLVYYTDYIDVQVWYMANDICYMVYGAW